MSNIPKSPVTPRSSEDPVRQRMARLAEQSQRVVSQVLARRAGAAAAPPQRDPLNVGGAFARAAWKRVKKPGRLVRGNVGLLKDHVRLAARVAGKALGRPAAPLVEAARTDRRFQDPAWTNRAVFDFLKQSYLLTARRVEGWVQDLDGLDAGDAAKVEFYTRQMMAALSPSNFLLTNPVVLRETVDTRGRNLLAGAENLLRDLEAGGGSLRIRITDEEAFSPGRNLAMTPGRVVARTDLCELLQYSPTTPTVHKTPLLLIPPWINKFYVLDLRPQNSMVKWLVDQGHTVFCLSWVNPDERHAHKGFEHYMTDGPLEAMKQIRQLTGEPDVHAVGYCLGGTLLASTAAFMAARKWDGLRSLTFFTTLTDFSRVGELALFIEEETLAALDRKMEARGYLKGEEMQLPFSLMRSNDLIWSHVVNNYLLGKQPFPFDMLYWASDSTRMPARMHSFYLRQMYRENRLTTPGGITLMDTPLDLGRISTPAYFLSASEDHIAPWQSTYRAVETFGGPVHFTLANSGHIAGVINPPQNNKYGFRTAATHPPDPQEWLKATTEHPGSWWTHWEAWLNQRGSQGMVAARVPPDGLEAAPGQYCRVREGDLPQAW